MPSMMGRDDVPREDFVDTQCFDRPCPNPVTWKGILVYPRVVPVASKKDWIEKEGFSCDEHEDRLYKKKRVKCEHCDTPLEGRKVRWCSKICWALGNRKVGWLWRLLHDRQAGLCGICVLPLNVPSGWLKYEPDAAGLVYVSPFDPSNPHKRLVEVDHVEPVARGGKYELDNLRAAHRACNQAKKTKDLAFYRWQIGALAEEVEDRLQGVEDDVCALLVEPRVVAGDYQASGPGVIDGQGGLL